MNHYPVLSQRNALKSRCPRGHVYNKRNTRIDSRGWRRCKPCERIQNREAKRRLYKFGSRKSVSQQELYELEGSKKVFKLPLPY